MNFNPLKVSDVAAKLHSRLIIEMPFIKLKTMVIKAWEHDDYDPLLIY